MAAQTEPQIDTQLFSRQLATMDMATQLRIMSSKFLLIGLQGVGVEIAKDLVLMGVKAVTIVDQELVTVPDLGSQVRTLELVPLTFQFYLTESDVGKPRGPACVRKLANLSRHVKVTAVPYDESLIGEHDVIELYYY